MKQILTNCLKCFNKSLVVMLPSEAINEVNVDELLDIFQRKLSFDAA